MRFSVSGALYTPACSALIHRAWWRHQMETFSALLAICAGNSPVPGEFSTQRPVTRSFNVFFDRRLNKRLSKQSWGWWFETQSRPLWRQCNGARSFLGITGLTWSNKSKRRVLFNDSFVVSSLSEDMTVCKPHRFDKSLYMAGVTRALCLSVALYMVITIKLLHCHTLYYIAIIPFK